MSDESWHHRFSPKDFLSRVNIDSLLERNDAYEENRVEKLGAPCFVCMGVQGPGLLLNDKSYICKGCFSEITLIRYPEKYEESRRSHLRQVEARKAARGAFVAESPYLKSNSTCNTLAWASLLLVLASFWFLALTGFLFFLAWKYQDDHDSSVRWWEEQNPIPSEPELKQFHDPSALLTARDKKILHVFNHWPGYPPYWGYLREVVIGRDGSRCQVTGCPSRLSLHVHHMRPVSEGGEHAPSNLVSLCDFHHALEPEKGHERIWGEIKTRYFTLVRPHERQNRASGGSHSVRAHVRRLELISSKDVQLISEHYAFACPECGGSVSIEVQQSTIAVRCAGCHIVSEGPRQLAEESGPRLAELLAIGKNNGRWAPRWDMLAERTASSWGHWNRQAAAARRERYRERVAQDESKPKCPRCGAEMRLKKPRPGDSWRAFWGCSQYKVSGCKGSATFREK